MTAVGLFLAVGAVAMVAWGYVAVQICDVFQISVLGQTQPPCPDWSWAVALAVLTASIITSLAVTAWFAGRRWGRARRGSSTSQSRAPCHRGEKCGSVTIIVMVSCWRRRP